MRLSPQKYLVAGALLCCAAHAHAQLRPAVLELFTSEGCSSCPPAEAYIGELAQRPNVLALAYVIDGRADFVGSDVASIDKRLSEKRSGVALGVAVHGGEVLIDLGMQERAAPSDVILIAYLRNAVSNIARGENSGRTLTEFNIVRAIRTLGRWDGRMQQYRAALKSLPSDATDVAVLVQPSGQGPITGAGMCALR